MKYFLLTAFFLLFIVESKAWVPVAIKKQFRLVIKLIKENKMPDLAQMVQYPLKRQDPLPDIANAKAFIAYHGRLFDTAFLKKIQLYSDTDIFEHNGGYGLVGGPFHGDIWMNEKGKITGITVIKGEEELRKQLTLKIQSEIHPSVNKWKENVVMCKSDRLTIRIDDTDKGLRYVSWSKGKLVAEKPDLILFNGVAEAQGTMGGWTWTFVNGDWTYLVDDVEMCQMPRYCGYFLRLLFKGVEKSTVRLMRVKF